MSTLTFSLLYIALGCVALFGTWILSTTPERKFLSLRPRTTGAIQVIVNVCHLLSGVFFPLPLPYDIPVRSFGLTLFTVGVVLAIWAKLTMKENWGFPGFHNISIQKRLITTGPFEYSRNPIYMGLILVSFGMAIALKSAFIFLVFVLYSHFYNRIKREEKQLDEFFSAAYQSYCNKVERFI